MRRLLLLAFLGGCQGVLTGPPVWQQPPTEPPVDPHPTTPVTELAPFEPAPLRPRLLLSHQYVNAVRARRATCW